MVTEPLDRDPLPRRAVLVLLAIAAAGTAWLCAAAIGPALGTEAIWPFDRLGLVLAALGGIEALGPFRRRSGNRI